MAVGDVLQLSVNQSLYGVVCVNVLHFEQLATPVGMDELRDLCEAWQASCETAWQNAFSVDYTLDCLVARNLQNPAGGTYELLSGAAGLKSGDALPPNAVVCGSVYSATYLKTGRGRMYMSGIRTVDERDNCLETTASNLIQTYLIATSGTVGPGGGGGTYRRVLWTGTPPSKKNVEKVELRTAIRKLRGRTMKRACG